mmetsp:Transcript_30684/g.97997  ORF Transcript_30684/g.97997 Transcript_30684/m.97997 type:complete len:108 (+) Transcript_30684:166-489(+)
MTAGGAPRHTGWAKEAEKGIWTLTPHSYPPPRQELNGKLEAYEHEGTEGILRYRADNAKLVNRLEKEYRDKVKELEAQCRAEAFATLDEAVQAAVAERDSLKAYFNT